jgi:hypothetical protein
MRAGAGEWKLREPGRLPTLPGPSLVVLPYIGGKKEKVVSPWSGFSSKPALELRPCTAVGEDTYDQSFTPDKTDQTVCNYNHELNRARYITRETQACILTS